MITYNEFLNSIKERGYDDMVLSALGFLLKEGYITRDEFENRKSDRLNKIKAQSSFKGGIFVSLYFDDSEWNITVEVDSNFNIITVKLNTGKEEETLYHIY